MRALEAKPPPPKQNQRCRSSSCSPTLLNAATGLLSYQSIGNSEQEMRHTTVILPPTLICQVTPAQLPCSNPKTCCWSGFTSLLPLFKQRGWKTGANHRRLLLYLVENFSLAGNLHISYKCAFLSEAPPLFYCTNLLPVSGAGKKMEEGAIETERQCETERNKGRKREQERGVHGEMQQTGRDAGCVYCLPRDHLV